MSNSRTGGALLFLNLRLEAFNIYIAFFGLWCVLTGYLIFKSTFMPLQLWLLFVGVNAQRWRQQATVAVTSS